MPIKPCSLKRLLPLFLAAVWAVAPAWPQDSADSEGSKALVINNASPGYGAARTIVKDWLFQARAAQMQRDYVRSLEILFDVLEYEPGNAEARRMIRQAAGFEAAEHVRQVQEERRRILAEARAVVEARARASKLIAMRASVPAAQASRSSLGPVYNHHPAVTAHAAPVSSWLPFAPTEAEVAALLAPRLAAPGLERDDSSAPARAAPKSSATRRRQAQSPRRRSAPRRAAPAARAAQKAPAVPEASSETLDAWYAQAQKAYGTGDLATALALLDQVLERRPGYAAARQLQEAIVTEQARTHYIAGLIAYGRGNMEDAMIQWQEALKAKPDDVKSRRALLRARKEFEALKRP